jgi:hypothetical protein
MKRGDKRSFCRNTRCSWEEAHGIGKSNPAAMGLEWEWELATSTCPQS